MANPGVGNRYVSVNLNKSYGQQSNHHYNHAPHSNSYGSNRTRPGSGGGGGGMVVLSRPRSSQKVGAKLSVPPPLNLPSLRKEHEKYDSLGSSGGHPGGGIAGSGSRPASAAVGWTKPATVVLQENEASGDDHPVNEIGDQGLHSVDGVSKGNNGVYMPPSARLSAVGVSAPASDRLFPSVEKATFLRGEDFPSLRATLAANSGPTQKHEVSSLKQKQVVGDEFSKEHRDNNYSSSSRTDMRPQLHPGRDSGFAENVGERRDGSRLSEQARKQEYFPAPLPLFRLNTRSDWADDERDTSHGLTDRGRDFGYSRNEASWDRDFDMPRATYLPQKPAAQTVFDRRGQRDNETGKVSSSEVSKADPYGRDVRTPSEGREGNSWRASSPLSKDGSGLQEVGSNRNNFGGRSSNVSREMTKESKYVPSSSRDSTQENIGRRDVPYEQPARQQWNNTNDSLRNRGGEWNSRDRYGNEQQTRHRSDAFQSSSMSKAPYSFGGKGLSVNDPILNFGREKRPTSKSEKPYFEDPFMKDFGDNGFGGSFPGSLVGVVKKKKEAQTDFHDPVRESFEAELERVQKMQEEERRRNILEQERAIELARREEEQRLQLARDQEERQRRLEDEAREAAWRAEQEQLESTQRAEELRIAREEEKRRAAMEEERRKQAAKQKLIELEEKIAKRQAEAEKSGGISSTVVDEKMSGMIKEREDLKMAEMADWEDGERMVERITTSASSDSSVLNRPFEVSSGPQFSRDGSSAFVDRGKLVSSWRRDAFESGSNSTFIGQDLENGHHNAMRDGSRVFPKKEFHGAARFTSPRPYYRAGAPESHLDEYSHPKSQRWNIGGDQDHYNRNNEVESDVHENLVDIGWGHSQSQGRSHGNSQSPYPDRLFHNPEEDRYNPFGRARFSVRQPRVLPPPPLVSMHKGSSFRGEGERPGSSTFLENDMQYNHAARGEGRALAGYDGGHQENLAQLGIVDMQESARKEEQKLDGNLVPRCDSQSSLSVSSPPTSPIHLSHDDLDESGDSSMLSTAVGRDITLLGQDNEATPLPTDTTKDNTLRASVSVSYGDDAEWTVDNSEQLLEQEEYDEDEDGYQEDAPEGEDENIDLTQEFKDIRLQEEGSPDRMENVVLGFNEGVEVGIPNDDFKRSSGIEEATFATPQLSVANVGHGYPDGMNDGQIVQPEVQQMNVDSFSRVSQETQKTGKDVVIQPDHSPMSTPTELLGKVVASTSSVSTQEMDQPSGNVALLPSSAPLTPSQTEMPVQLQFGLFSGPTLLPTPVRAIQIGSIEMPLPFNAHIGQSVTHIHPSQSPIFQFGQLSYTAPISQGLLPMRLQSVPLGQPKAQATFSINQKSEAPATFQAGQTSFNSTAKQPADYSPLSLSRNQAGVVPRSSDISHRNILKSSSSMPVGESTKAEMSQQRQVEMSHGDGNLKAQSASPEDCQIKIDGWGFESSTTRESEAQLQTGAVMSFPVPRRKDMSGPKAQGRVNGRGRRQSYTAKDSGSGLSSMGSEVSDSNGYQRRPRRQRMEFRVRENHDKRQFPGAASSNHRPPVDKYTMSAKVPATSMRNGTRMPNKSTKQTTEWEGSGSGSQDLDSGSRSGRGGGIGLSTKSQNASNSIEGYHKRNLGSEDDNDMPLQSGVVRVFEQPGIEAASDDDDFIEVRSKRQMLNERREQREKQIRANFRAPKVPRKSQFVSQDTVVAFSSQKDYANRGGEAANKKSYISATSERRCSANTGVAAGANAPVVPQSMAPVGTAVKAGVRAGSQSQIAKSLQISTVPAVSGVQDDASTFIYESKNNVPDHVQTCMGSWGSSQVKQPVMVLRQSQPDKVVKPASFDSRNSGDHPSSVGEINMVSSTKLGKDKSFSSVTSPISSLLAGEKIQFGAVTSPTILPPSNHTVTHGIGPPRPSRGDIQNSHNASASENDCSLFFEKGKHQNGSCIHMEDCEAEAEAAASAVAVAAITNDETGDNALSSHSVSVAETKSFGGAGLDGIAETGIGGDQAGQSKAEESLIVSLPADLSVETPPMSLWPPLPSPQNSSNSMISHFPGGPPSHFPFYEMNPMMGGPIFAFGPHDESAGNQSQSQKSGASVSGPLGSWQQCHSGVDSFYGPPGGFPGPFITPPGGIPGVQGPPHMVVYNHFAPLGQFGQVGLSFMGATYIPSGKQPDWKHNPVSSAMGVGEGDANMTTTQRNPNNMPPVQHLAPGSPLLPMPTPLAMFDVSPFQSPPDMSVQARWSHLPPSALQSNLPMPLQQQKEGIFSSQFNHGPIDQTLTNKRFHENRASVSSDSNVTDATVNQLPDELGLVETSSSSTTVVSKQTGVTKSTSLSVIADGSQTNHSQNGSIGNHSGKYADSNFKPRYSHQKSGQHYTDYHQRGGGVGKNSSDVEWSNRRTFHGRNQSISGERGFQGTKMKQIYVVKQTQSSGAPSTS